MTNARSSTDGEGRPGPRHRPSLIKLRQDQREDVIAPLEDPDGLDSRAEVLKWLQKTAIRTLGRLDDAFFAEAPMRPDLLDILTDSTEGAQVRRSMIIDEMLLPACQHAHWRLRKQAHEHVNDPDGHGGGGAPDPSEQKFVAMRPSLHDLDETQRRVIEDGLTAFETQRDLRDWALTVVDASESLMPKSFAQTVIYRPEWAMAFRGRLEELEGQVTRETRMAESILPRFNRAARDLLTTAQEGESEKDSGVDPTPTDAY